MVLLKASGPDGFVYYTHHGSAKGRDVESNPLAAVTFYWYPLRRQVRASGRVERVSLQESDRYFATRPRGRFVVWTFPWPWVSARRPQPPSLYTFFFLPR